MPKLTLSARLENLLFGHRLIVVGLFVLATMGFVWSASGLHIDAGFAKQLPLKHPYMATFVKHQQEFGGANRLLVAIVARDGNMFTPGFFDALKGATDEVFFLPGVDRARVQSLFTPNVRYTEVVEDGIAAGDVIPEDFTTTPEGLAAVRRNILKAGIVGRLVANDFSGAIISAELLEFDPTTGQRLDFLAVARDIETHVREKFDADFVPGSVVDVHIIGFAKVMGDMASGAQRVVLFFLGSFFLTGGLVFLYAQSHRLAFLVLSCAALAVVWQLGVINLLGFGIDPMSILVPFLVFAIAREPRHADDQLVRVGGLRRRRPRDGGPQEFPPSAAPGMGGARHGCHWLRDHSVHRDSGHPGNRDCSGDRRGGHHPHEPGAVAGRPQLRQVRLAVPRPSPPPRPSHGAALAPFLRRRDAGSGDRHRGAGRCAGRRRSVEGSAGADRRPSPRRPGTASRFAVQHRHGHRDVEVLDRRRRAERDRRDEAAGVRRPRRHDDD